MSQNIYVDRTLQFNDGGGGTAKVIMDSDDADSILYILPATDATQYVAFGNGTKNMDVKFFGATSGKYMLWDESADKLLLYSTFTVGVDDTGYDVKFFGATASSYLLWDESADTLILNASKLTVVGTVTTAIDLSSVTPSTNAGGDQATLIKAGTAGAKMLFATDYQQAMLFHFKTTGGRFTGLEMNVYTEDESEAAGRELRGIEVIGRSLADTGSSDSIYAICGSVQILSGRSAPLAGGKIVGGYFAYSVDAAAASSAGWATCIYCETGSGKNMTQGDYAIYMISNNAASKPLTAFMACYGGANALFQLGPEMTPSNGQAWDSSTGINPGTTAAGWIRLSCWTGAAFEDRFIAMVTGT